MFDKALKAVQKGIQTIKDNITGTPGSKIAINGKTYIEERLISEGGYGYIYLVTEPSTSIQYALKRINISTKAQLKGIKNEIDIWKKIANSKFIIKLIDYEITSTAAFILMDYAPEGTLLDFITKRTKSLTENEALNIVYQITCGLSHMHKQFPPIAHRDIKIENVLKCGSVFKLCDFGSGTSFVLDPNIEDKKVIQMQFSLFEKNSTFIYRPPEMCDVYSNYVVNEKVDIWGLGCIFYSILFKCHPFQDAQKLAIISGQYQIPKYSENYSEKLIDLMRLMLTPNPGNRPDCVKLIEIMKKWKNVTQIELSEEVIKIKEMQKNTVNRPEIDQFFFNQNEINTHHEFIVNGNNVDNSNKQEVWDFDFGTKAQPQNQFQPQPQSQSESNNNANLLDFEFYDNAQPIDNSNTHINDSKTNTQGGQFNLLDEFDSFTFKATPTNTTNTNTKILQSNTNTNKDTNNSDSNNDIYGFNFDFKSKPEPVFTSSTSNIENNSHYKNNHHHNNNNSINNNSNKNKQNKNTIDNQPTDQDILSFF